MHSQQWRRHQKPRYKTAAACFAVLAMAIAACSSSATSSTSSSTSGSSGGSSSSSSSSSSSGSAGGSKTAGGTATWALQPSAAPNYIFPFTSSTYFSNVNAEEFQYLMYRPLYWFGNGASPTLNTGLSLASPPVYKGKQVTITMKGWKWSNGEAVNAQDLLFWIHMLQAVGTQDWGDYVPGLFPSNISDVRAVSATTLTMTMAKTYNPAWFTDNELSQLTPMPLAWDRTAAGPSDCVAKVSDCAAVYSYLDSQSKALSTWVASPLWSVVDGPWKLASFNASGNSTFVPNPDYSGPVKPTLAKFEELPFTTESAEYNVLQAGAASGGQKIDVGYIPTTDVPNKPAGASVGPNPVNGYTLAPLIEWAINYFPVNLQSTTGNGPVNRQLYFRQALQYLVNQKAVIDGPLHGYGSYTVGPVGTYPATPYLSSLGQQGDPFPYNPARAQELLASHGWKVVPNGITTCQDPGTGPAQCGTGISQGHQLVYTLPYATGVNWIESEMGQLQSNASLVGIKLNLEPKPFNQVTATAAPNCVVAHTSCDWDMGNWGGGWSFVPDYYPSGETLFQSGAGANSSGYSNPKNDALINQTLTSDSPTSLYAWQDYVSTQVPVIWQPNGVYAMYEVASNLHGVLPENTTGNLNPEDWYFAQ